jgi:hypothetical protein
MEVWAPAIGGRKKMREKPKDEGKKQLESSIVEVVEPL